MNGKFDYAKRLRLNFDQHMTCLMQFKAGMAGTFAYSNSPFIISN